jgi:hypothetical protein
LGPIMAVMLDFVDATFLGWRLVFQDREAWLDKSRMRALVRARNARLGARPECAQGLLNSIVAVWVASAAKDNES